MGFQKNKLIQKDFLWDFDVTNADADSTLATGTIPLLSVPAGTLVTKVQAHVIALVTGATSEIVGDGTDPNGWILDTFAAGTGFVPVNNQDALRGAFALDDLVGTTDALDNRTSAKQKLYTSADTIDFILGGTATAGKIRFSIEFMVLQG